MIWNLYRTLVSPRVRVFAPSGLCDFSESLLGRVGAVFMVVDLFGRETEAWTRESVR